MHIVIKTHHLFPFLSNENFKDNTMKQQQKLTNKMIQKNYQLKTWHILPCCAVCVIKKCEETRPVEDKRRSGMST